MKNIILQHWAGEMDELGTRSSANIAKYAKKLGADYKLLRGNVFRENLSAPMQKLYMLNEIFDSYDVVVMLDIDVFTRKGMEDDIFKDETAVGMVTPCQERLHKSLLRIRPKLTSPNHPYWGGSIYRLEKDLRQRLRAYFNDEDMKQFTGQGNFEDEGTMHRLATLANVEKSRLSGVNKWSHGSFETGIEKAAIIHIRTKVTPTGPKRDKIINYRDLVTRGIIEE